MLTAVKHKSRRQLGVVGICFALMMGASACTLAEGGMYKVTTGYGVYMNIFEVPTAYISRYLYVNACGGNYTCTGWYLHDHIDISGWGAAEWEQATREQGSQQQLAIYLYAINVHSPQTMYDVHAGGNCLVLVKDFGLFSTSLHWEELGMNSSDCQKGTDPTLNAVDLQPNTLRHTPTSVSPVTSLQDYREKKQSQPAVVLGEAA